ncbi:hypothetical protein IE53DRAFT_390360 [Violaceomyces palustris]|uniref:Uncharacterized protein n=1 Tax=Violaceomyces palustris TaxID=1673888 RepID=A0ACD0NNY9_9BASI|nr:hypothetical protein IE53DRAFT_390360 [Violaceomyces palustris]
MNQPNARRRRPTALLSLLLLTLLTCDPANAQLTGSALSLDFGGGSNPVASTPSSSAAPSSTISNSPATSPLPSDSVGPATVSTSPLPSPGSVSIQSTNSVTNAPITQSVTHLAPKPLTSSTSYDVMAIPSNLPNVTRTASSNFTLPSPVAVATFTSLPKIDSSPYQVVLANQNGLPTFEWNLAAESVSQSQKQQICDSQVSFCATSGCSDPKAKLTNFCETEYMGTACYCSSGSSRLSQYNWPVMLADCRGRNIACKDACLKPNSGTVDKNKCTQACDANFGNNCGNPGQYAANYAVRKEGQKPNYEIIQGGTAANSASPLLASHSAIVLLAAFSVSALFVLA